MNDLDISTRISVKLGDLRDAILLTAPVASTDDSLPILGQVQIRFDAEAATLTFLSTDRYIAAEETIPAEALDVDREGETVESWTFYAPARGLLAVLPKVAPAGKRKADLAVTLFVRKEDTLAFIGNGTSVGVVVAYEDTSRVIDIHEYPPVYRLFPSDNSPEPDTESDHWSLSAKTITRLVASFARRSEPNFNFRVFGKASKKQILAYPLAGSKKTFRVLLMTLRMN